MIDEPSDTGTVTVQGISDTGEILWQISLGHEQVKYLQMRVWRDIKKQPQSFALNNLQLNPGRSAHDD